MPESVPEKQGGENQSCTKQTHYESGHLNALVFGENSGICPSAGREQAETINCIPQLCFSIP
jgi:hypothetical protein